MAFNLILLAHAQRERAAAVALGLAVAAAGALCTPAREAAAQAQTSATPSPEFSQARAALLEAERLIDAGELQTGVKKAAEALARYRALPDDNAVAILGRGDANYLLGKAFGANDENARAADYWKAAITQYERLEGKTANERLFGVLSQLLPILERLGRRDDLLTFLAKVAPLEAELNRPADEQAQTLSNLGVLLMRAGRSREAVLQLEQAIALAERAKVPARDLSKYLYHLGLIENKLGRTSSAVQHFRKAQSLLGPLEENRLRQAEIGLDLAHALRAERKPDEARRELDRAVGLLGTDAEATLMKAKLLVSVALDDYDRLGKTDAAISTFREVLRLTAGRKGAEEIEAAAVVNIANDLGRRGRLDETIDLYRDALTRQEAASVSAETISTTRQNLGLALVKAGRNSEGLQQLLAALRAQWEPLVADLPAMARLEKQMAANDQGDLLLPIYATAFTGTGLGDAYEATLLTKAIVTEATRVERATDESARSERAAALNGRYLELRRELSRRTLQPLDASQADEKTSLAREAQDLERTLRTDASVFRPDARLAPVRPADVRARLRPGEVLLDYVTYRSYSLPTLQAGDLHYGVFVMDGRTGVVTAIDLGAREQIDALIARFRDRESAQADPISGRLDEAELGRAGDAVRARVLDPALEGRPRPTRIYVSPDSFIGLVPFEALPASPSAGTVRYLIEDTEIVYLLTGRDLARRETATATASGDVWLVGDPAFDATPERRLSAPLAPVAGPSPTAAASPGQRVVAGAEDLTLESQSQVPTDWARLDVTRNIVLTTADAVRKAGLTPRILLDVQASEDMVYSVRRPRAVMFATHGFFMSSMPTVHMHISSTAAAGTSINEDLFETGDPLHRSMLILAGANRRTHHVLRYLVNGRLISEAEARGRGLTSDQLALQQRELGDGLLTAYEIVDMDLVGTELVLLTACESGLGVAQGDASPGIRQAEGEGVAGMRQAFIIAGARSLVMSMWQVPVNETAQQIGTFFDRWLSRGQPRYQAFRASQLAALANTRRQTGGGHPFWWAGFVYLGDPGDR